MNFYEMMKYANTGIAPPNASGYELMKAAALCKRKQSKPEPEREQKPDASEIEQENKKST